MFEYKLVQNPTLEVSVYGNSATEWRVTNQSQITADLRYGFGPRRQEAPPGAIDKPVLADPRHHHPQFRADLLDRVVCRAPPHRLEARLPRVSL